jgi:hypothetical protein
MISVDRLGWGKSVISEANIKPLSKRKKNSKDQRQSKKIAGDFELQARSIASMMAQYPNKNW